jgi:2-oxoglutarate ferredoxin oxidoreductase subunit gamma
MAFQYSIRLSGAGGYGLIQAARILAEAAAIYDNKNAAESCSYGPEARGSACRAEIIVSDEAIDYPKAKTIDFLVALTQQAYDRYKKDLPPNGTIVVDSTIDMGSPGQHWQVFRVPFTGMAANLDPQFPLINMIALGFFARVSSIISSTSIRQAILARIPKKSEEMYLKAFEIGLNAEAEVIGGSKA